MFTISYSVPDTVLDSAESRYERDLAELLQITCNPLAVL
jgi:hypothetical protein